MSNTTPKPKLTIVKTERQKAKEAFVLRAYQYKVPKHLISSLADFFIDGVPVGSFLQSVLTNDLKMACAKADEYSQKGLWDIVNFCYNVLACSSWGSQEAYDSWIALHQKMRKQNAT